MSPVLLHQSLTAVAMCAERFGDPVHFDDVTVRVRGVLAPEDRCRLELTHFDTGALIDGWSVWMPKEAGDDS